MRLQFSLVFCSFLCGKLRTCHDNLSSDLTSTAVYNMQHATARTIKGFFFFKTEFVLMKAL